MYHADESELTEHSFLPIDIRLIPIFLVLQSSVYWLPAMCGSLLMSVAWTWCLWSLMLPEALLRTMGHPAAGGCEYLSTVLPLEAILMSMATTDISHVTTEGMWLSVVCAAA